MGHTKYNHNKTGYEAIPEIGNCAFQNTGVEIKNNAIKRRSGEPPKD